MTIRCTKAGPASLRSLVGPHYFDSIQGIYFRASEELLEDISNLRGIEVLNIDAMILTDLDSLRPIARMRGLEALTLRFAQIIPKIRGLLPVRLEVGK